MTDGVSGSDVVQASGTGSRIDLSHLSTLSGGGGPINFNALLGGEVDLGGSLNEATLTVDSSVSTLNVSNVTSLRNANVNASLDATMPFSTLTALTIVSVHANSGAVIAFPGVMTDGVSGSDVVQAGGTGSRIDLSHLSTLSGGGGPINFNVLDGGEVDLGGNISNAVLTVNSSSDLNVAAVTRLSNITLAASNGGVFTFPSGWSPDFGNGVTLTASGTGSSLINDANLNLIGTTLTINTSAFANQGTMDADASGVTVTINGSGGVTNQGLLEATDGATMAIDSPAWTNAANGTLVASDGTVSISNYANFTDQGLITVDSGGRVVNGYIAGTSPLSTIQSQLKSGYNNGAWNGPGINSASAAMSAGKFGLGYADGNVGGETAAQPNQVLVRYALVGDANLDGNVNLTDLLALLNSYGQSGQDWAHGDFNYDGSVNLTDLLSLLNNYGQSANDASIATPAATVISFEAQTTPFASEPLTLNSAGSLMGAVSNSNDADSDLLQSDQSLL